VDVALWDLRGEKEGRPLYALIGAQPREIPSYGSGVDLPKPLDELLAQVEGFMERNLPGVKVKIGRPDFEEDMERVAAVRDLVGDGVDLPKPLDELLAQVEGFMERGLPGVKVKIGRPDFEEDVERVAAVRDLVGDGVDLMLDANMVWNAEDALEHGRHLEPFDPFWYEEPTIPEDVPAHARMVRELGMPIAVGESLHSPYEFQRYADEGAVEVLQIDPITNGGITASLMALKVADAAGLQTSSHYTDELSAHLLCASNNPVYLEKHAFALDPYLREPQKVEGGNVRPTETPGTGLRFDEAALEPHRAD
ncbi:MAG: mandelate racemase/muconate lactonizing enzyme family protein, partial [Actinomycetota bacterium]|nr:mandelate racemase/muconate lactonizing enzyme family protein [Actinomycetota bacterium]